MCYISCLREARKEYGLGGWKYMTVERRKEYESVNFLNAF